MKNMMNACAGLVLLGASAAQAAPAREGEGMSLLGYLFLGFFALIIVSQLVPAAILFCGMIKGVLSTRREEKTVE